MKRAAIIFFLLLIAGVVCFAGELQEVRRIAKLPDREYTGARIEVRNFDQTRVDLLTEEYAIECDFSSKWAEGVGQALYYSELTGKRAGLVLLVRDMNAEKVNLLRAKIATRRAGVRLWIEKVEKE